MQFVSRECEKAASILSEDMYGICARRQPLVRAALIDAVARAKLNSKSQMVSDGQKIVQDTHLAQMCKLFCVASMWVTLARVLPSKADETEKVRLLQLTCDLLLHQFGPSWHLLVSEIYWSGLAPGEQEEFKYKRGMFNFVYLKIGKIATEIEHTIRNGNYKGEFEVGKRYPISQELINSIYFNGKRDSERSIFADIDLVKALCSVVDIIGTDFRNQYFVTE